MAKRSIIERNEAFRGLHDTQGYNKHRRHDWKKKKNSIGAFCLLRSDLYLTLQSTLGYLFDNAQYPRLFSLGTTSLNRGMLLWILFLFNTTWLSFSVSSFLKCGLVANWTTLKKNSHDSTSRCERTSRIVHNDKNHDVKSISYWLIIPSLSSIT